MFFLAASRDWEYESGSDSQSVVGNLYKCQEFWEKELETSPYVLGIIKNGYRLPLKKLPTKFFAKNNASALKHKKFVEKSIQELLLQGCIEEVQEIPHCCNPLTVAEGNKLRLVLDLRHVNKSLDYPKFKYENLKVASEHLEKDYFLTTFDLKSA